LKRIFLRNHFFTQLAHAHENLLAVKMDGITKEEFAWGFRVGFVTYGIKGGGTELYKALEDKTAGAVRVIFPMPRIFPNHYC